MSQALICAASAMCALWGVAHLFATRGAVTGFGALTVDDRLIITTGWSVEGVAFIATAALAAVATAVPPEATVTSAICAVVVASLVALAMVSPLTGFRIAPVPSGLCPRLLGTAAALTAAGALP